jgi:hypothetical protein
MLDRVTGRRSQDQERRRGLVRMAGVWLAGIIVSAIIGRILDGVRGRATASTKRGPRSARSVGGAGGA